MNTLPLATMLCASLLVACASQEAPRAAPQPESEVGFSAAGDHDVGPATETSPNDALVPDAATTPTDATYADVPSSKDTSVGDVIELREGGPPDAAPDTEVPDVLTLVDTALPGLGDAPPPGP